MAYDKVIDSALLNAGMTATADAIRAKTGRTDPIVWEAENGFKSAVEGIQTEPEDAIVEVIANQNVFYMPGASDHIQIEAPGSQIFSNLKVGDTMLLRALTTTTTTTTPNLKYSAIGAKITRHVFYLRAYSSVTQIRYTHVYMFVVSIEKPNATITIG
jgi:hypothetical protein